MSDYLAMRRKQMEELQAELERHIANFPLPKGYGLLVMLAEVGLPPGKSFKALASRNLADDDVPKLLASTLANVREQTASARKGKH